MQLELSEFQERILLLTGGATLLSLGLRKREPGWGGLALVALGAVLVPSGIRWLEHRHGRCGPIPLPVFDKVAESSEESFPASDPPAWAMGA